MTTKIDALREMKKRRGEETIILFHNKELYEAYSKDATIVSEVLGIDMVEIDDISTVQIIESQIETVTNGLLDAGYAICISEMRDSQGAFIVDVNHEIYYEEKK